MTKIIKKLLTLSATFSLLSLITPIASADSKLNLLIKGEHRSSKFVARDQYRNPKETLAFFGLKEDMTVVEILPGGGWYAEILAPYLKDKGTYIAAGYDPNSKIEFFRHNAKVFIDKLKANPEIYGKTQLTIMQPPQILDVAPESSVDLVLSFRNTHNWHRRGNAEAVYGAIFKALKPGGVFGVVQHRAGEKVPTDTSGKRGYLKQADVIAIAEKVGFKLDATSEINANPKDTKDYEKGVWTLPPVFAMGDKNKEQYLAIGESDRMTLRFIKPKK